MFSFLKKSFTKKAVLAVFGVLFLAGLLFVSCSNPTSSDTGFQAPAELIGTWVSVWGEDNIITATSFSNEYAGSVSYAGTIVNVRGDGPGAGYITIRYTENTYIPEAVGNYYVIHYKNFAASSMSLSGAGTNDPPNYGADGFSSQSVAETTYKAEDGYFAAYSGCHKTGSITPWPANPLKGTWSNNTLGDTFVINDETITYQNTGYPLFYGEIINVRDNGATGYITFRYIDNGQVGGGDDLLGKYCVLYWENYGITSASMAVASENWTYGDEGQDTQAAAEAEYTADNANNYYDLDSFTKE